MSFSKVTIDSIPEELIAEIFMLCLPQDKFTIYHRSSAPLSLCRICRKWRNTVLSLPLLWSSISITIHPSGAIRPGLDFIKIWLERTGSQPLMISCCSHAIGTANDRVMDTLIPEFHRWKSLSLILFRQRWDIDSFVGKIPEISGSRLEELDVDSISVPLTEDKGQRFTRILGMAPRLHSVTWHSLPQSLVFPWRQLKKFHSKCPRFAYECFDIIRQSPLLLDLSVDISYPDDAAMPSHSLTHGIRSLEITASVALVSMFDLLTLPSLCEVTIRITKIGTHWSPAEFVDLLSRSRCPLRKLNLHAEEFEGRTSSEDALISCLHVVSSTLEELTFCGTTTDRLFVLLTSSDTADNKTTSSVCPNLKSLVLLGTVHSSVTVLADMVKSRLPHGHAGIQYIDVLLETPEGFLDEDEELLRDVLYDGLTMTHSIAGHETVRVRWSNIVNHHDI